MSQTDPSKTQVKSKPKKKSQTNSQNSNKTYSQEIQQKFKMLKEILVYQDHTKSTIKSSNLSNGSIVSLKNRTKLINKSKTKNQNTKQSQKKGLIQQIPVKKQTINDQQHLLTSKLINSQKVIQGSEKTKFAVHQKKNKKVLSFLDFSSDFQRLQSRLEKFKPQKTGITLLKSTLLEKYENLEQQKQNQVLKLHEQQKINLSYQAQPKQKNTWNVLSSCQQINRKIHERKNNSCISNCSNSSNIYLKPIHQQNILESKIFDRKEKLKNSKISREKPSMSFSVLLSRKSKNNSKKASLKLRDEIKYQSWLLIKKSKSQYQNVKGKEIQRKMNKSKQKSSRKYRINSCSGSKQKIKDRSQSSYRLGTITSSPTRSFGKENRLNNINQMSNNLNNEFQQDQNNQTKKNQELQFILTNINSSKNLTRRIQTKRSQQFRYPDQQTQKREDVRQLHKKYEIEQLTLRLKQQLKKISSVLKCSDKKKTLSNSSHKLSTQSHRKSSSRKSKQKNTGIKNKNQIIQQLQKNQSKFNDLRVKYKTRDLIKIEHQNYQLSDFCQKLLVCREHDPVKVNILSINDEKSQKIIEEYKEFKPEYLNFDQYDARNKQKVNYISEFQFQLKKDTRSQNYSSLYFQQKDETQLLNESVKINIEKEDVIVINSEDFQSPTSNKDQNSSERNEQVSLKILKIQQIPIQNLLQASQEQIQCHEQLQDAFQFEVGNFKQDLKNQNNLKVNSVQQWKSYEECKEAELGKVQVNFKRPYESPTHNKKSEQSLKSNSFQQFAKIYSDLLISITHYGNFHFLIDQQNIKDLRNEGQMYSNKLSESQSSIDKKRFQTNEEQKYSLLMKNILQPLGAPSINILQMMRQYSLLNCSDLFPSRLQFKEKQDEDDSKEDIQFYQENESLLIQSPQITQNEDEKNQFSTVQNQHQDQNLCENNWLQNSNQQNSPNTLSGVNKQEDSEFIIPPEIYYQLQSQITKVLSNPQLNPSFQQHQNHPQFFSKRSNTLIFTNFQQLIFFIKEIYSNNIEPQKTQSLHRNEESSNPTHILEFYQDRLKFFSLAIYDLTNITLDQLRPFGSRGLPPLNFKNNIKINHLKLSEVKSFMHSKLSEQIFSIKLGLLIENLNSQRLKETFYSSLQSSTNAKANSSAKQITRKSRNFNQQKVQKKIYEIEQNESTKAERLSKIIIKCLEKEAAIVNRQLDEEYQQLDDVKFQIMYEVWSELQLLILEQEMQAIMDILERTK